MISATPASLVEPGPGVLLHGRYLLEREIGQGGFGVVYLARDKQAHRRVAVKQINIGKLKPREIIDATDSYNREVTVLSRLRHPRLPRLYDHFTDPEHWYLVMDYIHGQTLEEYLQSVPGNGVPIRKAVKIGIQLCKVLEYLHEQKPPIIFRDVKPANIMLTPQGKVYLIDFGIARRFNASSVKDTGPLGSPGYAAPEQYGKAQTNTHTDVYGLGVTLQTLITGKDPLEDQASPAQPQIPLRLPRKLSRLLEQMIEKESRKRPSTMHIVKERLEDLYYGKWRLVSSSLKGFLLGIAPYALLIFLSSSAGFTLICGAPLFYLLYCFWPFIFATQLIVGLALLFQERRRLIGLGMLVGLLLFVLALVLHIGQVVPYLSWPPWAGA
ncbi:MAG TPA: serine/threonine-protein kinase [Ktedonobacteraceae bacterium]